MQSPRQQIHTRFAQFLGLVQKENWPAAHEMMSKQYRELQSAETTKVFGSELAAATLAASEAWLISSSDDAYAYVLPFDPAEDSEIPPAAYGLTLEDGCWKLTGEIVEGIWDAEDLKSGGFEPLSRG